MDRVNVTDLSRTHQLIKICTRTFSMLAHAHHTSSGVKRYRVQTNRNALRVAKAPVIGNSTEKYPRSCIFRRRFDGWFQKCGAIEHISTFVL